ncbi:MAG: putative transport system ATP-binding protein [Thermoanaerobaculia bacterium]|jgi:putative ABC transport system ATP-binding protein|nr:putative transport system ATP-binding protein [Thermoanaerobaculia bacterium]
MITLRNVSRTYETSAGGFTALRHFDLDVTRGELVAVVGKSGSGKSTLLNVIGGIDAVSSGSVTIDGKSIETLGESRLAAWRGLTVGFVFQFFQLLPALTAAENVMLPMDFCGMFPPRERRSRASALLERFGVGAQADKLPASLSGGEQQRVAIARALANDPPIVLADEPTGNLDSINAGAVLDLFRAMASSGTTVLIATHDRDVARVIDRTIELADGALVAAAPVPPATAGQG